jgi:hypothetical protein
MILCRKMQVWRIGVIMAGGGAWKFFCLLVDGWENTDQKALIYETCEGNGLRHIINGMDSNSTSMREPARFENQCLLGTRPHDCFSYPFTEFVTN